MPQKISVYGSDQGTAFDLAQGDSHYYVTYGSAAENGVVAWIAVKPLPPDEHYPGEKILEVTNFAYEAGEDGNRRFFYTVTNTGAGYVLAYEIYCAWTDAINIA